MIKAIPKVLPKQQQKNVRSQRTNENEVIHWSVVCSYRQSRIQRIRLPIKRIFSAASPKKRRISVIFCCYFCSVSEFSGQFHTIERSKWFLFADAHTHRLQSEPFSHLGTHCRTRWLLTGPREKHLNPRRKYVNATNIKAKREIEKINRHKLERACCIKNVTEETKRLILTVNIDTSDYLNMYATLKVQLNVNGMK